MEGSVKVKTELSKWIGEDDRIIDRRVIDNYGTEVVITQTGPDMFSVLRGFSLGEGAGVSVDVSEKPLATVMSNLLSHYKL